MNENIALITSYRLTGVNFQKSAERLKRCIELNDDVRPETLTALPLYFLASHSAELFLKAALLKRGFDESELRKFDYRHNLAALLSELQEKGVPLTDNITTVINGLSEQHKNHSLRYTVFVDDGVKTYMPPLALVFSALDELLLATRISTHGV